MVRRGPGQAIGEHLPRRNIDRSAVKPPKRSAGGRNSRDRLDRSDDMSLVSLVLKCRGRWRCAFRHGLRYGVLICPFCRLPLWSSLLSALLLLAAAHAAARE